MLKRVIWSGIAIVIITWVVNSKIENNRIREENLIVEKQRTEAIRAGVNALVKTHDITTNWVNTLSSGNKYRSRPVLSVELERAWIDNGPILFWGSLEDIATLDENHYLVTFERNLWANMGFRFDTDFRLSLRARKSQIDSFLESNPDIFEDYGFNNGVALVAKINEIHSNDVSDPECGINNLKIGGGDFLDLIFTGDNKPLSWTILE